MGNNNDKSIKTRFSDMDPSGERTEWVCDHGIGHHRGVHGCDGCCVNEPKMELTTLDEDVEELKEKPPMVEQMIADETYVKSVAIPDELKSPIEGPVYYNKFSQYICDKNDVPLVEVLVEDERVGQFISSVINNFK